MSAPFRRPPIWILMPFAATAPEPRRGLIVIAHGHLRGAAESDAALKLGRNVLGHKLRVGGHVVYFHDVHQHVLAGHLGELSLDLLLLSALTADDHARLRAMEVTRMRGLLVALSIVRSISILGTPAL
jgi:hypothetical protein